MRCCGSTGAVFQCGTKEHVGVVTNEPGALCWTELTTSDLGRRSFYTGLFGGPRSAATRARAMEYTEMNNNGVSGVGMMPSRADAGAGPVLLEPSSCEATSNASAGKRSSSARSCDACRRDIGTASRVAEQRSVLRSSRGRA